ncbi:CDP-glucose 4,6-dehydratase [Saprospiraceae bacterium]|nr:CDP-glucose 4,6-dehydratase [Saprospiraceae bacterium]
MENLEIENSYEGLYSDKTVLITGHTGFKGSWLANWLISLGAKVVGFSLEAQTNPNHFDLLGLEKKMTHIIGDVRDKDTLLKVFNTYKPTLVFHLAAQALVRPSYDLPLETFSINLMGTANLFECVRQCDFVLGIVNVTSDKCYENFEDDRAYNEKDRMGGYDPYSASKGGAELIANSFRSSFFNPAEYGKSHTKILASVRAGNVIGGGDWSKDRLIPDIVKSVSQNLVTSIRSPLATRPWQHVLEPLSGYLQIGQHILEGNVEVSEAWNFGPDNSATMTVGDVIKLAASNWDKIKFQLHEPKNKPHEANLLRLDCEKAKQELNWYSVWGAKETVERTIKWYKSFYLQKQISTEEDLMDYTSDAKSKGLKWAINDI